MSSRHPASASTQRPVDARRVALQQNAGSAISALLAPERARKEAAARAPNHALLNRQNLRATQLRNQLAREEAEVKAQEAPFKMSRFSGVPSVLRGQLDAGGFQAQRTHDYTRKGEGKGVVAKLSALSINRTGVPDRSRARTGAASAGRRGAPASASSGVSRRSGSSGGGQQYAEGYGEDSYQQQQYQQQHAPQHAYDEGQQHYDDYDDDAGGYEPHPEQGHYDPEAYPPQHEAPPQQQQFESYDDGEDGEEESLHGLMRGPQSHPPPPQPPAHLTRGQPLASGGGGASSATAAGGKSFIARNARAAAVSSRRPAQRSTEEKDAAQASARHGDYGRVPRYIEEAKAAAAAKRAAEDAAAAEAALGIPAGMKLLGEEERLATLSVLQSNREAVLRELAAFPLRVETHSRRKAKAELEAKLEEIEKAIGLFSRKRVLIHP